ncbi:MAG: NAD-dependent epimerase/dehydratase family protein, partial [Flavobacteriales bacterium]
MNILITGGTGLIGKRLTEILLSKGHEVSILSRSKKQSEKVTFYTWDIAKQEIEKVAIQKADYIIHLAGANVGEGRWTDKRKKEIIDSRVQSGYLLLDAVKEHNPNLKGFISSSAVGYYG